MLKLLISCWYGGVVLACRYMFAMENLTSIFPELYMVCGMIYITFEREGPLFSNITARALAYRTAVQQRQLRAKWLL